ncbi:hypothetical protein ACHAXA_007507 [Cyclostephanos tholiformis]|uniref:Uncharacterized protein n=1 Tax=Cyclostephanos tholiformis TaxID=382380 RepID=A0ABD3REP0_9STRA
MSYGTKYSSIPSSITVGRVRHGDASVGDVAYRDSSCDLDRRRGWGPVIRRRRSRAGDDMTTTWTKGSYMDGAAAKDVGVGRDGRYFVMEDGTNGTINNSIVTSEGSNSRFSSISRTSSTGRELAPYMPPPIGHVMVPKARHNGWNVPLGVHRVICSRPGLRITTQVHRRSAPVVVTRRTTSGPATSDNRRSRGEIVEVDLIIPPGSYVNVLETQIHGDRVRGRICWEEEGDEKVGGNGKRGGGITTRTSRLLKRTAVTVSRGIKDKGRKRITKRRYEGWLSLQWAKDDRGTYEGGAFEDDLDEKKDGGVRSGATDEDSGPWTEPVPLGVYRINFSGGLPLRATSERDSVLLDKLQRGRCVEVIETEVKGDRVRARVIVPDLPLHDEDDVEVASIVARRFSGLGTSRSGWISLMNAHTGASGASPVPLGAYVVVAEPGGCIVTEGGGLDSKVKYKLLPGSCMEIVATRIESGLVRGLIDGGGHVTLFVPPRMKMSAHAGSNDINDFGSIGAEGRRSDDGGTMLAMPVPLGTYQIVRTGLSVTLGMHSDSSIIMKLPSKSMAEVVETCVENERVRGRICSVVNEDGARVVVEGERRGGSISVTSSVGMSADVTGWIDLFEKHQRWAKIVRFKGERWMDFSD